MTAVILHLSDIHIKGTDDPVLSRSQKIAASTYSSLPPASHAFVLVSGDIAFSGKAEQYELASKFLTQIKNCIQEQRNLPVSIVVTPGNHDCDFDLDNKMRQIAIKHLAEDGVGQIDDSVIGQCTCVQKAFFRFRDSISAKDRTDFDELWCTNRFEVDGKTLAFDCLNVSWLSKKHEDQGAIVFPHERYKMKEEDGADVRILMMHHPLNWFNAATYRPFRTFIRRLANIIITGHEHQGNVGENLDSESAHSAYVEGCVLQGDKDVSDSSFNIIILDLDNGQYRSNRYSWKKDVYESGEEGSWSDYRELPAKRRNPLEVLSEFRSILDDPGAAFKHANHNLALADFYVFPDMAELDPENSRRQILTTSVLRDPARTTVGALLQGEEKVGCTSLLYRLYDEYHERGFAPIYLRGRDIKKVNDRDLDALIRRAVIEQYGSAAVTHYEQLPLAKKLLLLDDFDDTPIRSGSDRAAALGAFRARFKHLIVTVGELFEIREMIGGPEAAGQLREFQHYRMLPLGFALRTKLIQRWFRIGSDGTVDEATFLAKWDQAEKLIEGVMQRNIIPSVPLFLLILLQSIDAGRSGDFKESALGFYYQYLFTEGFQGAGVPVDKLSEAFEFSTKLAWHFHTKAASELRTVDLRAFNETFSTTYYPGDFQARVDTLVRAKILAKRGDYYFFRYPYAYYFLKGRYLSQTLSDTNVRDYVGRCCAHLYVRENANTILFLAHHTNDDFVIEAIVKTLRGLFDDCKPVTFSGDMTAIAAVIENAPKLKYSGEKPEVHRTRVSKIKDEIDDGSDGLAEKEEGGKSLSLVAQLTILGKTVDILGQILKNQYARIERTRKVDLITELFSGPLRSLRGFHDFLENTPDYLVAEIDSALEKRAHLKDSERRKALARKIVATIVQAISYSFIHKAGASVSGEVLSADVHEAVRRNSTLAFRLIESGLLLDSPTPVPREILTKLKEDAETDPVALRVLHLQVLQHLYMFRTSEEDKQWLSSERGIELDLKLQHAIELRTTKTKKLKEKH